MVRTVISLDPEDKAWLDRTAVEQGVPMTEVVREAIRQLRAASDRPVPSYEALLDRTRGTWRHGDGLAWQDRMRDEW